MEEGWQRVEENALQHASGNYRISRALVDDKYVYTLWSRKGLVWDRVKHGSSPSQLMKEVRKS